MTQPMVCIASRALRWIFLGGLWKLTSCQKSDLYVSLQSSSCIVHYFHQYSGELSYIWSLYSASSTFMIAEIILVVNYPSEIANSSLYNVSWHRPALENLDIRPKTKKNWSLAKTQDPVYLVSIQLGNNCRIPYHIMSNLLTCVGVLWKTRYIRITILIQWCNTGAKYYLVQGKKS